MNSIIKSIEDNIKDIHRNLLLLDNEEDGILIDEMRAYIIEFSNILKRYKENKNNEIQTQAR